MLHTLDTQIPQWMATFDVPAASVVLLDETSVTYRAGFGGMQSDTVMSVQSLTKPLVAWRTLQLVREGYLALDTPLRDYLDQPYAPSEPRIDAITAQHVLSHTSGLPNWREPDAALTLQFAPSTDFAYSGEGYCYLQTALEAITGQTLAQLLQPLFETFGMTDSSMLTFSDEQLQIHPIACFPQLTTNAAFGLMSSADDLTGFMRAMLDESYHTLTDLMRTKQHGVNGDANLGWGLGWGIEETDDGRYFWQWGAGWGKRHLAIGSRDRRWAALILTDSDDERGLLLADAILRQHNAALGAWRH